MACIFQLGETVILSIVITDSDGDNVDPAAVVITITDPLDATIVNEVAMTNDGVGLFHYDFNSTTGQTAGLWTVCYKATDAPRVTIVPETFRMVACP